MNSEASRTVADRGTEMRIADALETVANFMHLLIPPQPVPDRKPSVGTILDTAYPELLVTWMRCDFEGTFSRSVQHGLSAFELNLSMRARKVIRKIEAQTVGDIARAGKLKLLKMRSCGRTTVREIERQLKEHGLTLGT